MACRQSVANAAPSALLRRPFCPMRACPPRHRYPTMFMKMQMVRS